MASTPQIRILNYTGRRVTVFASRADHAGKEYQPVGIAHITSTSESSQPLDGMPVIVHRFHEVRDLPRPEPGVFYLVSATVYDCAVASGRTDVLRLGERRHTRGIGDAAEYFIRPTHEVSDGVPGEVTEDMDVYTGIGSAA